MSGNEYGPGKVLEGFQSLIYEGETEETTPVLEQGSQEAKDAQSKEGSEFKPATPSKESVTTPKTRPVQKIFRNS